MVGSAEVTMNYFAFGSNLHIPRMRLRCPGAAPVERAWLPDHRLVFRSRGGGSGVATVVPAEGRRVPGGIWRITDNDLVALDRYEGVPSHYRREIVTVDAERSGPIDVLVYVMVEPNRDADPHSYYLQTIIEGLRMWRMKPAPWLYKLGNRVGETEALHACR
jgi:gamma-glutamylcyclotransferase (GGCT)/AIG2-like uncharacterized protein YtfP